MTRTVALNNVDHQDLRVALRHGAAFGDAANRLPLFPTEFEEAQREFPILFDRTPEGGLQAVALLGFDRDENLFLDGDRWTSRHVPLVQQRGPFSIGVPADENAAADPVIHIDLDDPRVGAGEGESLFLPHGGNAPYLDMVGRVLRTIYAGIEQSRTMYALFDELGLVQPVNIEITLSDAERVALPDHMAITRDRLAQLDVSALDRLNAAGFLYPAHMAAASLSNVARLIRLKNTRRALR